MTKRYTSQTTGVYDGTVPAALADPAMLGGRVRALVGTINMASQPADADGIVLGKLPKGAVPLAHALLTDTSLGSATLALGKAGSAGKYRAAAVFTSTNALTWGMVPAAAGVKLTVAEEVIATVASAALPSSGILNVYLFYTLPEGA